MLNYQRVPSETTACQWGLNELSGECWLVSAFSYHISGLFSCHGYHKVLSSLISGFGFLINFFMSSLDFYGISMGFLWDFYRISMGFLSDILYHPGRLSGSHGAVLCGSGLHEFLGAREAALIRAFEKSTGAGESWWTWWLYNMLHGGFCCCCCCCCCCCFSNLF